MNSDDREAIEQLGAKAGLLTPGKRLAVGAALVVVGAALFFDVRSSYLPPLPYVVIAGGLLVIGSAWVGKRNKERLEREFADVLARWDELMAGAQAAEASGQSLVRYLRANGIERYEVRQFVLKRLRGEEPTGADSLRTRARLTAEPKGPGMPGAPGDPAKPWTEPPPGPRWLP